MTTVSTGQISVVDISDSKQLQLFISTNQPKTQIFNPVNSTYTPNWTTNKPVLTPQLFVAGTNSDIMTQAKSIKWFIDGVELTASNTDYTLAATGVKTLTINTNVLASVNSKLFVAEVVYTDPDTGFDVVAKADIELVKVSSGATGPQGPIGNTGAAAVTAVLSNETHIVPTDSAGANGVYGGAVSTMSVYQGATDDSANWTYAQTVVDLTVTASGTPANRTVTITGFGAGKDTGYVDITATKAGVTVTKRFVVSKGKQGATGGTGAAAVAYWLITPSAIQRNISGVYTPATITVEARSQSGAGVPAAYAGKFVIAESTDGVAFTDKYTSAANEATKTHTPTAGIKAVRVRLYQSGVTPNGTVNSIDEEVITVVSDGATGAPSVRAVVWTPDGNTIKNGSGTLVAKCDVYSGGTLVNASAYKWYIQDPAATTSSGGDVDGGPGWRLLNATYNAGTTGYDTNTLTIPASAVLGVESFKCVATYSGVKYPDVTTVTDVSDPIQTVITGVNVFKNGVGSTTLTAKLYRAGVEIDTGGTAYTYTWSLYDSANVKSTTFGGAGTKTGKTITVDAADVSVRGNIICDVSQ